MQPNLMTEISLLNSLLAFKKEHGNDALAALLRKLGVKSPNEIDSARFPEVQMLCRAGTRGLNVVEGEDGTTGASRELGKAITKRFGGDALTVIESAPTFQEGFNRLAAALHARGR